MIDFNGKLAFSKVLQKPIAGFDADKYYLKYKLVDYRDSSKITYTINGNTHNYSGGLESYSLPEIDTIYSCKWTLTPTNTIYQGISGSFNIFKNHSNCRYFVYGEDYKSTKIEKYNGSNNIVVIPDKHNLVYTDYARILSFPNVSADNIEITTPLNMHSFNIKDNKITKFTIKGSLTPIAHQFSDMPILADIIGDFTTSSEYMFANCPKLNMNPSNTKNMSSVADYAFYNTPSQKVLRFAASTLKQNSFDGAGEKVIFTSANTINGYDQTTLVSNTGLAYNGGKHQVYCGLNDIDWTGIATSNDKVQVLGYNNNPSETVVIGDIGVRPGCIAFKSDINVMGFFINIKSAGGTTKLLGRYYLPKDYYDGKSKVLYDEFMIDGNTKYFIISATQLYGENIVNNIDRLTVQAIDINGLSKNAYTYTITGAEVGEVPDDVITKIIYTGGAKTGTININNGEYTKEIASSTPVYDLYMTMDDDYPSIMFRFLKHNGDGYYNFGTENAPVYTKYHDFSSDTNITVGGRKVYRLRLTDYIPADNISTYPTFRVYYNGYSSPVYDFSLYSKQLSGTTPGVELIGSISISTKTLQIDKSGSATISAEASDGSNISWSIDNGNATLSKTTSESSEYITVSGVSAGNSVITASATIGKNTYTATCNLTITSKSIDRLPDTVTATNDIVKAAAVINKSSASITGIDENVMNLNTLGSNMYYLWLAQDTDKDVMAEYYDASGELVAGYDLSTLKMKVYTYSNTVQYNLKSLPNISTNCRLNVWYKNNPSKGEYNITLANKSTYTKS